MVQAFWLAVASPIITMHGLSERAFVGRVMRGLKLIAYGLDRYQTKDVQRTTTHCNRDCRHFSPYHWQKTTVVWDTILWTNCCVQRGSQCPNLNSRRFS